MPTDVFSEVGLGGDIAKGNQQTANAMNKAGAAGYAEANEQRNMAQRGSKEVIAAAQLQPGEIQSINQILADKQTALDTTTASLSKMQAQVDAMDPQVKAAGKNLYDLMSGKAAEMLGPIQAQIDLQRKQMMSNLSSQMGPGFMSSTAGLQAMTNFDIQTSSLVAQTQFQAISQASNVYSSTAGMQQQGQNAITSQFGSAWQLAQNANSVALQANQYGANRVTSATEFGQQMQQNAQQNMMGMAGGQFAGDAYLGSAKAQQASNMMGTLFSAGGFFGSGGPYGQKGAGSPQGGGGGKGGGYSGGMSDGWGMDVSGSEGGGGGGMAGNDFGGSSGAGAMSGKMFA